MTFLAVPWNLKNAAILAAAALPVASFGGWISRAGYGFKRGFDKRPDVAAALAGAPLSLDRRLPKQRFFNFGEC